MIKFAAVARDDLQADTILRGLAAFTGGERGGEGGKRVLGVVPPYTYK